MNKWGTKNNIKWVIIEVKWVIIETAPLTASGLNEIVAAGMSRSQCLAIAKAIGYKIGRRYQIVKLDDLYKEKPDAE